ncbi:hypothetical protein [Nonomuraea dietziae]|uniref:WXG100-like domain-containing protein n=1 Tax=Nonomuraea dietziae TaxID=65515 RepID=UPI003321E2B7
MATNTNAETAVQAPPESVAVVIDRDVVPAWDIGGLPDWVIHVVIPLLAAGEKWPKASEHKLSALGCAWESLCNGMTPHTEPAAEAVRSIVTGIQAPSTADFLGRVRNLYSGPGGVVTVQQGAKSYAAKASNFAVQTQYSKLSINVAFWITVIAIAIWMLTAFFTAGSTTTFIGPYAAAARAAIHRILVRLAALAGRSAGPASLARATTLSGTSHFLPRLIPFFKEVVEEAGEEGVMDWIAQGQQIEMGTRKERDWKMTSAALLGGAAGGAMGMAVAGPISRMTRTVPGFTGRALNTMLSNMVASPFGSFVANAVVYGQISNPFSVDSLTGAAAGALGRMKSISPTNVDVYTTLAHPITALATAHDLASAADLARAGGGPAGGPPSPGSPDAGGPQSGPNSPDSAPGTPPAPGTPGASNPTSTTTRPAPGPTTQEPGQPGRSTGQGGPDTDTTGSRRGSAANGDPTIAPTPDEMEEQESGESAPTSVSPAPPGEATPRPGTAPSATSGQQPSSAPAGDPATPGIAVDPATPGGTSASGETTPSADTGATNEVTNTGEAATGQDTGTPHPSPGEASTGDPSADAGSRTSNEADPGTGDPSQSSVSESGPAAVNTGPASDTELSQGAAPVYAARAREAVSAALVEGHPNAVLMPDGSLIVPLPGGDAVLPASTVERVRHKLQERAKNTDDVTLRAEANVMLEVELATESGQDEFAAFLAATQPAGLRGHGALRYALSRLAPAALEQSDGSLRMSDPRGDYLITADLLHRLRLALEASARAGSDPTMMRVQALAALAEIMAFSAQAAPLPPPVTSRPGTVTTAPVVGTAFVTGRSDGSTLSDAEVRTAVDELLATDILDGGVRGWSWSSDGTTLLVDTTAHGVQRFRPGHGPLSRHVMAKTKIAGGPNGEHLVTFNSAVATDQVARIWLRQITDVLQELSAPEKQGIIRTALRGGRKQTANENVTSLLNEHAHLARKWSETPQSRKRQQIRVDLDGVARELRALGHVPPPSPWAPVTPTRDVHTPDALTVDATDNAVREVITALTKAEAELSKQIKSKQDSAEKAGKDATEAKKEREKQLGTKDRGRKARAAQEDKNIEQHLAKQARDLRIAEAYQAALAKAKQTRAAYEAVLATMDIASAESGVPSGTAAAAARNSLRLAGELHAEYQQAVKQALPQAITLSSALPTATLPHLSKLTDSLNELLAQHGVNQRFTPSELNHILRADFRMIVSQDGMVMRVGHGDRSAELKIKLELSDLVEILDPDVKASEIMLGTMPQGGRTGRGTHAGSIGFNGSHKPATLFAPEGLGTALLEGVGSQWAPAWHSFLTAADVEFAASMGRGWSRDGSAAEFALGGAVEDNRGESMLFDAAATWKVRIRTARTDGWQDGVTISSGNPEDAASQRIWVAHSYADQPSKVTETLDPSKRSGKAMPEGVVSTMTGLHDLADRAMARLGESRTELGTVARDQLRTMITEEMPSRLNEEITRVITDETGRPVATVTARSRIKVTSAVMIGGRSADHWMERLRIAFSAAAGGGGFNGSLGGSISASLAALLGFGLKLKGGRGVSRSASGFVNDQAIHPSVHRVTDPTQGYQVEVETEISIQPVGDKQPRRAVKGKHEALIRLPEQDAFDIGLPVAREALVTDKDGNLVLDAEGVPLFKVDSLTDPPAGRKAELPVWVGDMDWQMKGAGPALVQHIKGMGDVAQQVVAKLGALGVVPTFSPDGPQFSSNEQERATQVSNLRQVLEQLTPERLEAGYDQAAQGGIPIDLVRYKANGKPEHYTVLIKVKQDFEGKKYLRRKRGLAVVNLDIGSDTGGRAGSRTWNVNGEASNGDLKYAPEEGEDGFKAEAGLSARGARSQTAGSSSATTFNRVALVESDGEVALFMVPHEVTVEIIRDGVVVGSPVTALGSAQLVFSADLLPREDEQARKEHKLSKETIAKLLPFATTVHTDASGVLKAGSQVAPTLMEAGALSSHHLTAAANVRGLLAHMEWLLNQYATGLAVLPQGPQPTVGGLAISGEFLSGKVLDIAKLVFGDIGLALASAGISVSGNWSHGFGVSPGMADLDDDGKSSDGGSGGYSRSANRSVGASVLDIYGVELLTILLGGHYGIVTETEFTVSGTEGTPNPLALGTVSSGAPQQQRVKAYSLMFVPEYHMLRMYADGEQTLSLPDVGDAVERFVNGSLTLDRSLATSLLQRYLSDLKKARDAGEDVTFAEEHTPQALKEALSKVEGLENVAKETDHKGRTPEEALDRALSRAQQVTDELSDVEVAPHHVGKMGLSGVESLTLTEPGTTRQGDEKPAVAMLDAVRGAIDTVAPGALADPVLSRSISGDFAIDRLEGQLDAMLSEQGFSKGYPTLADPETGRAELIVVRARLEPKGAPERAKLVGHNSEAGLIRQLYGYLETAMSRSFGSSHGFNVEGSSSDATDGGRLGLSTDRSRSFFASVTKQLTRMQRFAMFGGLDRVQQEFTLNITVEAVPLRSGTIRSAARRKVDLIKGRPRRSAPVTLDATMVRLLPKGMTSPRTAGESGPVPAVTDPRRVELPEKIMVSSVGDHPNHQPGLFQAVLDLIEKRSPQPLSPEERLELESRLSPNSIASRFPHLAGKGGFDLVRRAYKGLRNQGEDVRVEAHLSDMQVLTTPFDAELGEVHRDMTTTSQGVGRGHILPLGGSVGHSDASSGLSGGTSLGEQASEGITDAGGRRIEASEFMRGKVVLVRFRVDYDLTHQRVARLPDGTTKPVGDAVRQQAAATGTIDVAMFEADLKMIQARQELGQGVRWDFDNDGTPRFRFVPKVGEVGLAQQLATARAEARDKGELAFVNVTEHGKKYSFLAAPDGSLHSLQPDGGFAQELATLPPAVLDAAMDPRVDLNTIFMDSLVLGTFTDRVKAALADLGIDIPPGPPVWEVPVASTEDAGNGGQAATSPAAVGGAPAGGAGVTSPALPGTPFDAHARPADQPLTMSEVVGQDIAPEDFGGATPRLTWTNAEGVPITPETAGAVGDHAILIVSQADGDQYMRVAVAEPGDGLLGLTDLRSGTPDDPHLTWIAPGTGPLVLSSVLVHEISHVAQSGAAASAGAPQGVVRAALSESEQAEGTDLCLVPRLNEHNHLSRKWQEASDQATQLGLADAIDAIAADITERGHTPPVPPWGSGPRAAQAAPERISIAQLLGPGEPSTGGKRAVGALSTKPKALRRLARVAGVTEIAPTDQPHVFTVSTGDSSFTVVLTETAAPSSFPSGRDLAIGVSYGANPMSAEADTAGMIAGHVAQTAGRPPGSLMRPGPAPANLLAETPVFGVDDAVKFARLRSLADTLSEASLLMRPEIDSYFRAEIKAAGLTPGTQGATARLLAAARAGQLSPGHVEAIQGPSATLPELATAQAIDRVATTMEAGIRQHGRGLFDLQLYGRPPLPVHIVSGGQGGASVRDGVLVYEIDSRLSIGANERAVASAVAGALAEALGKPRTPTVLSGDPNAAELAVSDYRALAEFSEAVRQVATATRQQRTSRVRVAEEIAQRLGLTGTRTGGPGYAVNDTFHELLVELAHGQRHTSRLHDFLERGRQLSNATGGWFPPEEEDEKHKDKKKDENEGGTTPADAQKAV